MDCHCKDHLPGSWHSHDDCDCHKSEHPTYTFVVTKVMDHDPGNRTVYISSVFMEKLELTDGDPVEILDAGGCIAQAKPHPNAWIDTRMVSLDRITMDENRFQLYSQVKLRKARCPESELVTLEAPQGCSISRPQLRTMLEKLSGAVLVGSGNLSLKDNRGATISFKIVSTEPCAVSRLSPRTRVKLVDEEGNEFVSRADTSFADVGGLDEAIRKVREVVQLPLQHPQIFYRLGIDPPRGVLLHGPSGTGKTLIARAVAGETGCWFRSVIGTEIMDKHYGESEAKLRAAFDEAGKNAPSILFIDEIDALAPRRDTAEGEVERRVTAQLLALMDGMVDRGQVMVIAATNLPNNLDPALRRPGRFDREVLIGTPDLAGRRKILEIHTKDMPLGNVNLNELAEKTHGFVGADIKALCQESGYEAMRRILPGLENTPQQLSEDFLEALTVEAEDFSEALKDMRPSSGRNFEVNLKKAGWGYIAGYGKEKTYVEQTVLWPLQNAKALEKIGMSKPEGLLITGPSGVGKTLFARSMAKESGFNVIEIRTPELLSKYMGESEKNVRELFRQARQMAPTVLIMDGVDSFSSKGWSDAKYIDRIVNQLVMEMNSTLDSKPILVVGTAVQPADLPPVLTATGRFTNELKLKLPSDDDLNALFTRFLKTDHVSFSGEYQSLVDQARGLSCADVEEICRRAVLMGARKAMAQNSEIGAHIGIDQTDLDDALSDWKATRSVY